MIDVFDYERKRINIFYVIYRSVPDSTQFLLIIHCIPIIIYFRTINIKTILFYNGNKRKCFVCMYTLSK